MLPTLTTEQHIAWAQQVSHRDMLLGPSQHEGASPANELAKLNERHEA
jgi:hypothetical protein